MTIRAVIALMLTLGVAAQARELTLTQAEQLALEHSFTLKRAAAAHESAQATAGAARAERFGHVSLSAVGSWVSDIPQLTINLPTMTISRDVGIHENYQTDLRLSLPLYTGGRLSAGIAQASANADIMEALHRASREQVRFTSQAEFFATLASQRAVRIAETSQKRAQTILSDARSLYAAGVADSVALLESELASTRATLAVANAVSTSRQAQIRLATLCGLPLDEPLTLTNPNSETVTPTDATIDSSKPELASAAAAVRLNRALVRRTLADYLPSLAAFGGYSYGRPNLDRFNNSWNDYATVGANLTWSFSPGGKTRREHQAARWSLEAAERDAQAVGESLQQGAHLALEQLRLATTKHETAARELQLGEASYRLAQAQHREGTLSANRLLTIESDLTAAEISAELSAVNVQLARAAYLYALGRL